MLGAGGWGEEKEVVLVYYEVVPSETGRKGGGEEREMGKPLWWCLGMEFLMPGLAIVENPWCQVVSKLIYGTCVYKLHSSLHEVRVEFGLLMHLLNCLMLQIMYWISYVRYIQTFRLSKLHVSYFPSYKHFVRVELLIVLFVLAISLVSQSYVVLNLICMCLFRNDFSLFSNNPVVQKCYWYCVAY